MNKRERRLFQWVVLIGITSTGWSLCLAIAGYKYVTLAFGVVGAVCTAVAAGLVRRG